MTTNEKRSRLAVLVFSIAVFLIYLFPNSHGAVNTHILSITSQDESFQYPFLIHMLLPGETLFDTFKNIVSYHHYIYGYPFYLASWLVSLPLLFLFGNDLASHTGLHLLVLRQMISVLPMIISMVILVYQHTGFRSWKRSLGLLVFLSLIPGIVRQSINWWHPDALAILFAVLTIRFLVKDRFHYGRDFYLAALFCGLSTGTKLIGVFFFLVIAGYLITGYIKKVLSIQRMLVRSCLFIIIFFSSVLLSNPLLLVQQTRQDIIQTHLDHNQAFREGWQTSAEYETGPLSWLPVLGKWYGGPVCMLIGLAACLYGTTTKRNPFLNWVILGWVVPLTIYLFFLISVRPDHYWLPVVLPLYSSIMTFLEPKPIPMVVDNKNQTRSQLSKILGLLFVVFLVIQAGSFLGFDLRLFNDALAQEAILTACDSNPSNGMDNHPFLLETGRWYLLQSFDTRSHPQRYKFQIVQGDNLTKVRALPEAGQLAFACVDRQRAELRAKREARDIKLANPSAIVIGLDGMELPVNP